MVKLGADEDVSMIVFNGKDDVIAQLKQSENGVFNFVRLSADHGESLAPMVQKMI